MECDICGKREASFVIQIEGAKMGACRSCAYHGKIVLSLEEGAPRKEFASAKRGVPRGLRLEKDLIEGYGKIVRKAREKRGERIEELARKINEKASYLDKIENGSTRPPIETAKKLERELGVKILEKTEDGSVEVNVGKYRKKELSLLDMLEMQNKKEGK
jgi:putative transcription factor